MIKTTITCKTCSTEHIYQKFPKDKTKIYCSRKCANITIGKLGGRKRILEAETYSQAIAIGLCGYCRHRKATKGYKSCKKCRVIVKISTANVRKRQRKEVLKAYGNKCSCCGLEHQEFLEIDHINNDGGQHRKLTNPACFYGWLIRNRFPKLNFQILCHNCNITKWRYGKCAHSTSFEQIAINRTCINPNYKVLKLRERRAKLRKDVLEAYGNKCNCCDTNISPFLVIDHIFNDGNIERKKIDQSSFYGYLKRNSFPKNRYQILCFNCNIAKHRYGKCPHKKSLSA